MIEKLNYQTKTKEKCPVCYSRIYENTDRVHCIHDEERGILGSMLARADLVEVAKRILKEDDFDIEEHRVIYKVILKLFEQGIVYRRDKMPFWFDERGKRIPVSYLATLEIGCIPGAVFAPESPVSAKDVITYYAYKVKKKAIIRDLQESRLTLEEKDRFQDYLKTIDEKIKQTQTYKLILYEEHHEKDQKQKDHVLSKPKWVESPRLLNLRPDKKRIRELEKLRIKFGIPHDLFSMRVLGSPATTRKVQKQCLEGFRARDPGASEKELFRMVLISRIQAPAPESPGYSGMTEEKIDEAMRSINSFDELCDYIIALDEQEPASPDPFGIGKRIDEILAQEEMDKEAPSENLIKSLEDTYYDLRKKHPGRDEHWYLANTWLSRYGSTKQSKQKGPKLTQFIAYKDTHLYSILEPPKSIRGLALFLVYKELGERQALYYNSEFNLIMEPVMKIKAENLFLDKYKEKNHWTWERNQVEDDSSFSLYWFFRGLEFERDNPEKAKKLMERAEKRWEEDEKRKSNVKE